MRAGNASPARTDLTGPVSDPSLRDTAHADAGPTTRTRLPAVALRDTRHHPVGDVAPPVLRARAWMVADLDSGAILGRPGPGPGNDAAEARAGGDRRGRRGFIRTMNRLAARLGATDTVAKNPTGLDAPGAHSSARDLVMLLRAAAHQPRIARWLDVPGARFGALSDHRHWLSTSTDYVHLHPQSYAAKNGYTTNADNTLVTATRLGGHRIAVAVLGSPAGYTTTGAWALTRWAARNAQDIAPVGRLPEP